jgi:hypothetical protein
MVVDTVGPQVGKLSEFFTNATAFETSTLADETAWWEVYSTEGALSAGGAPIEFSQDSLVDVLSDVFSSIAVVKDIDDQVYFNQMMRTLLPAAAAAAGREDDVTEGSFTYVLEEPIGMGFALESEGVFSLSEGSNYTSTFNGSLSSARIYGLDTFVGAEVKVHGNNTIQPKVRTHVFV